MSINILILGAGGYIGQHLIPFLANQPNLRMTAVSSKAMPYRNPKVTAICSNLEELPLNIADDHDLILNLASAGVAHKNENEMQILHDNLTIANQACRFAKRSRHQLLIHFGSDTEQSSLSFCRPCAEGMNISTAMAQQPTSLYSLSKTMQTSLIHYFSSKSELFAHVIMTPNVYGGLNQPSSLLGAMHKAIEAGQPFTVQNPSIIKRFVHITAFSSYVVAVLQDLISRLDHCERISKLTLSSMDFVPRSTVGEFAKQQWRLLGGAASDLRGLQTD